MALTYETPSGVAYSVLTDSDGTGVCQVVKLGFGAIGSVATLVDNVGNEMPARALARLGQPAASSFTRPANTTAYAANAAVANSTTAGSVTPISITVADINDAPFSVYRAQLSTTCTGLAGIGFRIYFFNASPTPGAGDGATFTCPTTNLIATYSGTFITVSGSATQFSNGAVAFFTPEVGTFNITKPTSGAKTIFALLQTLQAFTPSSASTFTLSIEDAQGRS